MKSEIYARKLNEKYGFNAVGDIIPKGTTPFIRQDEFTIKGGKFKQLENTKKGNPRQHSKKKKCLCGNHSIPGHKEKSKYPKWKKKSRRVSHESMEVK